jgi:hypothetical protein
MLGELLGSHEKEHGLRIHNEAFSLMAEECNCALHSLLMKTADRPVRKPFVSLFPLLLSISGNSRKKMIILND